MFLTIDNLAAKYHLLPSEVLARADTFDLFVLDLGAKWANRQHVIASGKVPEPPVKKLSLQEMVDLVQRAKEQR